MEIHSNFVFQTSLLTSFLYFFVNTQMETIEGAWTLTQFNDIDELKTLVHSVVDPNTITVTIVKKIKFIFSFIFD